MSNKNIIFINILGLLGITSVLLTAFILQLILNELPCPLCLLQRIGFGMVMFGLMLNVRYGIKQRHYGIILIGAVFGLLTSLHQILLHVIPNTPAYGSAIFGFHYYTWAFILFITIILSVSILLILNDIDGNGNYVIGKFGRYVCLGAIAVIALNVVATFFECGPFQCPYDPINYWLF
ncbi:disulfide bond formation protein B [Shewanella surugensis]|uniref:Disulfide bond formation protein B n=1 Tax=Shewanella surugensis TaxID=212020 RepID=A0ABT0LK14_9GAMM|nr:disulfide bond formation protein B [Shewanella surugensis]MCL1128028.1 disulfide bond formation protein B [Shewanella surugensis]